jgi:hypothetical protein
MLLFFLGLVIVALVLGVGLAVKIAIWALIIGLIIGGALIVGGLFGGGGYWGRRW